MRKLLGLTVLLVLSCASVQFLFPEWANAKWREILALAGARMDAELATWDQLKSGRLHLGASSEKPATRQEASTYAAPVSAFPRKATGNPGKTQPPPAEKIVRPVAAPAPMKKPVSGTLQPAAVSGSPPPVAAAQGGTPEAKLGAILIHENRPEQMKEETFWTEEKVQEAIKNGPPRQRSAPCVAFCGNNNTVIEINTPD